MRMSFYGVLSDLSQYLWGVLFYFTEKKGSAPNQRRPPPLIRC